MYLHIINTYNDIFIQEVQESGEQNDGYNWQGGHQLRSQQTQSSWYRYDKGFLIITNYRYEEGFCLRIIIK